MLEYLSFGAGPPSVALMILNAWRDIPNPTDIIIFADTGGEKDATYNLLPIYEEWASEMGLTWIKTQADEGPLLDYVQNKSIVIPVHTENGIGHRQCTDQWKIRAIRAELRRRFGDTAGIAQLALTYNKKDVNRVKDAKYKDTINRYPLIERRLKRDACIEIIQIAGLPVPPWSACYFCPLQTEGVWRQLFAEHKGDAAKAVAVNRALPEGKTLHWSGKPLEVAYTTAQASMFDVTCDSGYCHT